MSILRKKSILVTGGAGFIGSNFVICALSKGYKVLNLDKLTYSGNLNNLKEVSANEAYSFVKGDIGNKELVDYLLNVYNPDYVVNFAAETHVDRSISDSSIFVETNVKSTDNLFNSVNSWFSRKKGIDFKFIHISTDEVYGSLGLADKRFTEEHPYRPNSPYSASKASSDMLARAYFKTYGLPVIVTNCSNNYGPRQYPEKLIPLTISRALQSREIPIYGKGDNVRDWLHVEDHCNAILTLLEKGVPGEKYNIGGDNEKTNLEVVQAILSSLESFYPELGSGKLQKLVKHVDDRLGHDFRYAIDYQKINNLTGWKPTIAFNQGIKETVKWYLENKYIFTL